MTDIAELREYIDQNLVESVTQLQRVSDALTDDTLAQVVLLGNISLIKAMRVLSEVQLELLNELKMR